MPVGEDVGSGDGDGGVRVAAEEGRGLGAAGFDEGAQTVPYQGRSGGGGVGQPAGGGGEGSGGVVAADVVQVVGGGPSDVRGRVAVERVEHGSVVSKRTYSMVVLMGSPFHTSTHGFGAPNP